MYSFPSLLCFAGCDFSMALTKKGTVYTWGSGRSGKLGHNCTTDESTPRVVEGLCGVTCIAASASRAFALTHKGEIFSWGLRYMRRLGGGNVMLRSSKVPRLMNEMKNVMIVCTGSSHSLALTRQGNDYCSFVRAGLFKYLGMDRLYNFVCVQ